MSPENLCFWLQGFLEISNDDAQELSARQVQIIKDHLALVFKKETPTYTMTTAVVVPYVDPNGKYREDTGGMKMTQIGLPKYEGVLMNTPIVGDGHGMDYNPPNRNDDIVPFQSGNDYWKGNLHGYTWDKNKNCWTVNIIPNTPVEVTQTSSFIQWDGIQVSC